MRSVDCGHIAKHVAGNRSALCTAFLIMVSWIGVLASGCTSKEDLTVWKATFPSPDGAWLASVSTVQNGGFGSAAINTSVYLARAGNSGSPTEVLGFSCNGPMARPYVLDNVANKGGSINLTMKWITPSHLEVTFSGHPDLYFQVVKYAGIEISVRDLSSVTSSN
jgi:hypothetical protein